MVKQGRGAQWPLSIAPYMTAASTHSAQRQHAAQYAALLAPYRLRLAEFRRAHAGFERAAPQGAGPLP